MSLSRKSSATSFSIPIVNVFFRRQRRRDVVLIRQNLNSLKRISSSHTDWFRECRFQYSPFCHFFNSTSMCASTILGVLFQVLAEYMTAVFPSWRFSIMAVVLSYAMHPAISRFPGSIAMSLSVFWDLDSWVHTRLYLGFTRMDGIS